ncbi:hypothetical protein QTP88_020939, partial [Uroleucon formosanum]
MVLCSKVRRILLTDNTFLRNRFRSKKHRRIGVHEMNKKRNELGEFHHIYNELRRDRMIERLKLIIQKLIVLLTTLIIQDVLKNKQRNAHSAALTLNAQGAAYRKQKLKRDKEIKKNSVSFEKYFKKNNEVLNKPETHPKIILEEPN